MGADVYCLDVTLQDVVVKIPKSNTIRYEVCAHVEYVTQCRYNERATVML
jgi:hypothetical protein